VDCIITLPQIGSWERMVAEPAIRGKDGTPPLILPVDFTLAVARTSRLDGLDSSRSGRMACKSSVAEITGKSSAKAQLMINAHLGEPK
jgi:hypothetical protein